MNKLRLAAMAALTVGGLVANTAFAAEPGAFVGVEWGRSEVDVELEDLGEGSDSDQGYVLRGGYYFTPNVAVEAFHANLFDKSEGGASVELDGYGVGVVGRRNFGADGNGFYLQARGGAFRAKGSMSLEGLGSGSDASTTPYFGIGAGYDFSPSIGLGVNYTRYRGDFEGVEFDSDLVTAALEYRF